MKAIQNGFNAFLHVTYPSNYDRYQKSGSAFFREEPVLGSLGLWKCVLRLLTARNRSIWAQFPNSNQRKPSNLFEILHANESADSLKSDYEEFRNSMPDFEEQMPTYIYNLFNKIKSEGALPLHKLSLLKEMLVDAHPEIIHRSLQDCIITCNNVNEANIMLLLHDVLIGSDQVGAIPPVAKLYEIYNKENMDPHGAIEVYKHDIYKSELEQFLTQSMEHFAKTTPPVPPPMTGSASIVKERKKQLVQSLGKEMAPVAKRKEYHIDVASRTMLKPAWQLQFYNDMKSIDPPSSGWELLMLDKQKCIQLYQDCISERLAEIKYDVLEKDGLETYRKSQEHSSVAMLTYCRKCQIAHTCTNISDWERIQRDRLHRQRERYNTDTEDLSVPIVPFSRSAIGGDKPLPQPSYVNPEDDPNYIPPGANSSSKLMHKIMKGNYYDDYDDGDENKYVLTDLKTRKSGLAKIAKLMEPFEHLPPDKLSNIVLRDCRKEYEFAEAVYRRRCRGRDIEDDDEKAEHPQTPDSKGEKEADANNNKHRMKHVKDGVDNYIYRGTNSNAISRGHLLTDVLVFLCTLEHLQWQFLCSIDIPIRTLYYTHTAGVSLTNPRFPLIKFTGWRFNEAYLSCQSYLGKTSTANEHRKYLHENISKHDAHENSNSAEKLLLFGDDPAFYLKDQEMLQQMVGTGVGLEIHTKVPGVTFSHNPTEEQKSSVFYRMSTSQPHRQLACPVCGYTVFSHSVKAHDGENLTSTEFDEAEKTLNPYCPICNIPSHILELKWTTGQRGYTEEPYPTPITDEFGSGDDDE